MNILDIAIAKKLAGGGGGSGTDNYNDLSNLPKINDTTLSGNKSSSALGLQSEINSDSKLASDLVDDTNQDNKFVTSTEKSTWNGKQNAIDADHKINADYVDDSTSTNKFVTASDKETWNAKQSAIDSSHKLSSDLVDDTNHTNKFVTSTEKQTWNAKQNAIDADHKLSSSLVSFTNAEAAALASGIDSSKVGQISTNQTNILYTIGKVGKNLLNFADSEIYNTRATYVKSDSDLVVSAISNWAYVGFPIGSLSGNVSLSFKISNLVNSDATPSVRISKNASGSEENLRVSFAANGTYNGNFNADGSNYYLIVYLNPSNDAKTISLTFSECMVCDKALYDADPSFEIYGRPNYELTKLESEDRAALAEQVDKGAKNILDEWNEILKNHTPSGNKVIVNGITYTYANGSITMSGTATENSYLFIITNTMMFSSDTPIVIAWRQKDVSTVTIAVQYTDDSPIISTDDVIIVPSGKLGTSSLFLTVPTGTTVSGSIDLMICTKAEYDISPNYVPFALSNPILTPALIECVNNGAKNKFNPEKATPGNVVTDGNGYAFKSAISDTRTIINFVLLAYNNDTLVGLLYDTDITSTGLFSCTFVKNSDFNLLRFGHSGAVYDLKVAVDVSDLEDGETYVLSFNVTATNPSVLMAWNSTMICTKAKWDVSHNFEPYTLPNYALTKLESEDRAALIECVDDGAKNLWDFANANITAGGGADRITYVKTADSLTLTAVSTWAFVSYDIALKKGTYYFYGLIRGLTGTDSKCVQIRVNGYQGTVIKRIDITANGAISDSFVVDTDRTITISLYAAEGEYTSSAFTISNLMICSEAAWNLSHNYESFALSNPVITSALIEQVDGGAKNVLRYTFEGSTSDNGITVTRNADGTITANGTAGSGNSYVILSQNLTLPAGTYIISAVNASDSNCYIYDNGSWESVSGRQERTLDGSTPVVILLRVAEGTTLSNVVIKPMICRIEAWNISTAFVPYRSDYNSIAKFIEGVDIGGTNAVSNADLNSIDRTITRIYDNPSNAPYGLYGFMLVKTLYVDVNTTFQEVTAVNNQTGTMFDSVRPKFIRTKTGGSWDPWIEISENNRFLIDDGSYEASSKTFNTTYLKYQRMYLISISRYYSTTSGSGVAMYAFNNHSSIPLVTTITEQSDCKATISVSNGVLTINYSEAGYYITSISLL